MANDYNISKKLGLADYNTQVKAAIENTNSYIKSLEALNKAVRDGVDAKKANQTAIKTEKKAVTELQKLKTQNLALNKKLTQTYLEDFKQNQKLKVSIQEKTKAVKDDVKAEREAKTAIDNANKSLETQVKTVRDAEAQNKALRIAVKNLDATTDEGKAAIDAYNDTINKNTAFIDDNSDKSKKAKQNVGNYTDSIKEAITQLEKESTSLNKTAQFQKDLLKQGNLTKTQQDKLQKEYSETSKKLDGVNTKLKKYGKAQDAANKNNLKTAKSLKTISSAFATVGIAFGAQTLIKGMKLLAASVFENSQTINDSFDIIKAKGVATFNAISRAIANADFSTIALDIENARRAAEGYQIAQDEIGDKQRSIAIETAEARRKVFELRETYQDTGKEGVKRLEAVQEANKVLIDLQEKQNNVSEFIVKSEKDRIKETFGLREDEISLFEEYIKKYSDGSSAVAKFEEENKAAIKEREKLQQDIIKNQGRENVGSGNFALNARKQLAIDKKRAAQIDVIFKKNGLTFDLYEKLKGAIDGTNDAERQRYTDAIVGLEQQKTATQRLITETVTSESTVRRSIDAEKEKSSAVDETSEAVNGLADSFAKLGGKIADDLSIGGFDPDTFKEDFFNAANAIIAKNTELTDEQKQAQEDYTNDYLENLAKRDAAEKQFYSDLEHAATTIITDQIGGVIDNDLAKFESSQESKKDILKQRLDDGKISEEQYQDEIDKLNLKSRQENAKAEKKKALYSIAIDTLTGVAKAVAASPLTFGLPFSAYVLGIGAAQAAAVAAKPIPKFKDGVQNFGGGMAIVGDGGESEMVIERNKVWMTPDTPTLVELERGASVLNQKQIANSEKNVINQTQIANTVNNEHDRYSRETLNVLNRIEKNGGKGVTAKQMSKIMTKQSVREGINRQLRGK